LAFFGFLVVSRFLNFPILNCEKSFRIWTSNPTPRASLCSQPGGYVREAGRPARVGAPAGHPQCAGPPEVCLGGAPAGHPSVRAPWGSAWGGCPAAAGRLSRPGSRRLGALVASGRLRFPLVGRESIFKISHTKLRKKFQNLDLEPDSTRKSLPSTRWVYEGGQRGPAGRELQQPLYVSRPLRAAWGGCPASAGHLSRRSDRCVATRFRPRRSCADPYGVPGDLPLASLA